MIEAQGVHAGDAPRSLTVLLASPRAFCAGVERAIETVERLLDEVGSPVYVRRQIVHNSHVVRALEERGVIFVEELAELPQGATVVFSAHGVSRAVRSEAAERGPRAIDATCPLVAKVRAEARRFAQRGDTIVLIGHHGHEEAEGTLGDAPEQTVLVQTVEEVEQLSLVGNVSYLMQTTLALDEASAVVDALRERFPGLSGPDSEDICYATTNRQNAVRAVAAEADVTDIQSAWLHDVKVVGLSAGASAGPALVSDVVEAPQAFETLDVLEREVATETVRFGLPLEVRRL
jgi:4-hydroxy-3-methylbut-2-enyl diphosphate reductase